eukprot:XP_001694211.1 predicted protein [Chlamydomonas reinhardtii]
MVVVLRWAPKLMPASAKAASDDMAAGGELGGWATGREMREGGRQLFAKAWGPDWKAAVGSHGRLVVSLVGAHGWAARALELDYERVDALDVLTETHNLLVTLVDLMQTEERTNRGATSAAMAATQRAVVNIRAQLMILKAASSMLRMLLSCRDAFVELRAALLRTQLIEHMAAALLSAAPATVTGALANMDANWGSLLTCASSVGSCINLLINGINQEEDYDEQEPPQWQPETLGGGVPATRQPLTQVIELEVNTCAYIVPAAYALAISARDCPFRLALTPPLRWGAKREGADTGAGAGSGAQEQQQQQGPCAPDVTAGTAATGPAAVAATASARLQAPSRSVGPEAAAVERTRAVNTYDVLYGAVDAMCAYSNTNMGLQDEKAMDARRLLVALLVRLLCKLRPRQAAARLAGLWRVLLCELGPTRFAYVAAEVGLLLRLQLEEGPRSRTTAVAPASVSPGASAAPAAVALAPHPAEQALTPSFSLRAYSPAAEQQLLMMSLCAWQWLPQVLFLAREGLGQYVQDVAARQLSIAVVHALRAEQHAAGAAGVVAGNATTGSSITGAAVAAAVTAETGSERGVVLCGNPACANTDGPSALFPAGGGKTCARCKAVWYCCGACQLAHWQQQGGHREACSKAQGQAQAQGQGRAALPCLDRCQSPPAIDPPSTLRYLLTTSEHAKTMFIICMAHSKRYCDLFVNFTRVHWTATAKARQPVHL